MPRRTEQEQQEIIRYIEADKPMPDKFRFLLFEDKREVELVWNGKTSEVCNIVLPFQVIEQVDEPRAEKPADRALQPGLFDARGRQLKGWTNKLIWGDNKLSLSSLKNGPLREEMKRASQEITKDPTLMRQAERSGITSQVTSLVRQAEQERGREKGKGVEKDEGLEW
jgi:hypothetical protein